MRLFNFCGDMQGNTENRQSVAFREKEEIFFSKLQT